MTTFRGNGGARMTRIHAAGSAPATHVSLMDMVGAGDKIGKLLLPFLIVGIALNVLFPDSFRVGGPSDPLRTVSVIVLVPGVIIWLWSVALILTKVPKGELITTGPYALVKHPLYVGVSLLVLPWLGFLLDTSLGVAFGALLYIASRLYAPEEEVGLKATFGRRWDEYASHVLLPWL